MKDLDSAISDAFWALSIPKAALEVNPRAIRTLCRIVALQHIAPVSDDLVVTRLSQLITLGKIQDAPPIWRSR